MSKKNIRMVKHCRKRVMSVRPPVLMQQSGIHRTGFSAISYWELHLKFVKSFRFWVKSDKNNRQCCTHSLELHWIKDRPVTETFSSQHTTFTRDRDPYTSRVLSPTFPAKRAVTDNALTRASTKIGAFSCLCIK